ncbi:helix-turn-helix domain-containing protein [Ethanoligenens sp.]|uniref:helix-turn-helix domain-containing protein n=1 Tax=Ethanoligenens sp. TaxID=2099655 RepID=UPI0039EA388B
MTGTEVSKAFSQKLSALIEDKRKSGMGIREIANRVGISTGALSKYQNDAAAPDINALWKISQFFNVSTDYLLGLSDFPNAKLELNDFLKTSEQNNDDIKNYQTCQKYVAWILNDIFRDDVSPIKRSSALAAFGYLLEDISQLRRILYITGKPEKPDFIKALDGSAQNTAMYIRTGRLKFDAKEFQFCEKALYAFLAQYYEILWENERLHPDPLLSNIQSSTSDVKEGKTHGDH